MLKKPNHIMIHPKFETSWMTALHLIQLKMFSMVNIFWQKEFIYWRKNIFHKINKKSNILCCRSHWNQYVICFLHFILDGQRSCFCLHLKSICYYLKRNQLKYNGVSCLRCSLRNIGRVYWHSKVCLKFVLVQNRSKIHNWKIHLNITSLMQRKM